MATRGLFEDWSIRTKIGAAVLTATLSGLLVGGVAINTVRNLNRGAAATQQQTLSVEAAVTAFSKNIEAFGGNVSALRLYPSLADTINQGIQANKAAISDALTQLETLLSGEPTGAQAVTKARQDWQAYLDF